MDKVSERLTMHWKDVCNLILGIWLAVSPWVLAYAMQETPAWNAHIVGVVVAVAAIATLVAFHKWEEWVNAALGLWLIVSPYLLGFANMRDALWNQIVVGVLIGGLAIWAAVTTTEGGLRTGH
jgi:hypothetical protein